MPNKRHPMSIAARVSLVSLLCIVLVLSALTFYVASVSKKALLALQVEALEVQTKMVSDMINVYGQSLNRPTLNLLGVFRATLPAGYTTGSKKIRTGEVDLPVLLVGDEELNNDTYLVDRFQTLTSAIGTVFVKSDDDFFRVSTSLTDAKNQRAVGTVLKRDNPAYAALLRSEGYVGPVTLFGKSYMSAYEPIRDDKQQIIGALFVGMDFD